MYIQVGIIEKDGGTLYCTALLVGRDGSVLLKHRKVSLADDYEDVSQRLSKNKLIPTAVERLVWGRGAGDGLSVVQTDIGKIGTLIW